MNNKWKIGILTSLLLTPAAVALAETPTDGSSTINLQLANVNHVDRAIEYFKALTLTSSMADLDFYEDLLLKAFPDPSNPTKVNTSNPGYQLLNGKLNYIKQYNANKQDASSLKLEIGKLTLTNKTIVDSFNEANAKYNLLISSFEEMNRSINSIKGNTVDDKNFAFIFGDTFFEGKSEPELANVTIAKLIEQKNQDILSARRVQVANLTKENGIIASINALYGVSEDSLTSQQYKGLIDAVNTAYSQLSTEEKTLADNQLVKDSNVTIKQALQKAQENMTKAGNVDKEISAISSINVDPNNPTSITNLKNHLIKIDKLYNALTPLQQKLISANSKAIVEPFQSILDISGKILALKPEPTTAYRTAVDNIYTSIQSINGISVGATNIPAEVVQLIVPNLDKLDAAKKDIDAAVVVEGLITGLTVKDSVTGEVLIPTKAAVADVRTKYNALSSNQKKLVMNVKDLASWENAEKNAAAVDKKIDAIVISSKIDFYKKFADAYEEFEKLNKDIEVPYLKKKAKLEALKPYALVVGNFYDLKSTDADYSEKVEQLLRDLKAAEEDPTLVQPTNVWTNSAIDNLTVLSDEERILLKTTRKILAERSDQTGGAASLVSAIDDLANVPAENIITTLISLRAQYNSLDSTAKKLVTNIKKLTEEEKKTKNALTFFRQVAALDPIDPKFVKATQTARKNYSKLPQALRNLVVSSEAKLKEHEAISNVMAEVDNLLKSKNISADAKAAEMNLNALIASLGTSEKELDLKKLLEETYKPKLSHALLREQAVATVIENINKLALSIEDAGTWIKTIGEGYKALSSNDKKLVSNYSSFKEIEKNYKSALKVYNLIEALPAKESADYTKKVEAALKAYQKLTVDQTKYVLNYSTKLEPFIKVALLIGDIESLKSSAKDFRQVVEQLRARYDDLTEAEKQQVYNYNKLVAAEDSLKGAAHVIQLIQEARPGVEGYLEKLLAAREAYDNLFSDQKKQVTNYKTLQDREKALKPVLDLTDMIEKIALQSTAKNFISLYEKAQKAYEAISLQDRKILTNEKALTETYVPLYTVMRQIEMIKPNSNQFVSETKAAREAFNRLTSEQQAKILNLPLLVQHEVNVEGGKAVDEMIRKLKSNPKDEYVLRVQEAEAAYKALTSANKKAVTLYPELQAELKFIAPVVQAMKEIDLLAVSGDKLAAQVTKVEKIFAKLTDEQFELIPNMDKYLNLGNVIKVVGLIEMIKPSDTKYYIGNTQAAEIAYNRLSPDEKAKVTNYPKLEEALLNVEALDRITNKISELSSLSNTYEMDVENLLAEYKNLPSALKKQVTNYGMLEKAKKDIDAAKKVTNLIAAIDSSVRTFESKVIAAKKALDKLTEEQRALVTNTRLLQQYMSDLGLQ